MPGSFSAMIRCSLRRLATPSQITSTEDRHHPQQVHPEVRPDAEQRRPVPQAVHDHRADVAEQDVADLGERVAVLQREPHADAEHRGEQRMGERRHDQPHRRGQQRVADRLTAADVEDVLQPGEPGADQARVDQAVRQRVQLIAAPPGHHEQQEQPLGRLFGQRRAEHDGDRADRFGCAGVDRGLGDELKYRRDDDGDRCAPEKRQHQQPRRLRLPPVQPQIRQHDDRHRDAGQHESDARSDGVERRQRDDDQAGDGAQQDQHAKRRPDLADLLLYRRIRRNELKWLLRRTGIRHQSRVAG